MTANALLKKLEGNPCIIASLEKYWPDGPYTLMYAGLDNLWAVLDSTLREKLAFYNACTLVLWVLYTHLILINSLGEHNIIQIFYINFFDDLCTQPMGITIAHNQLGLYSFQPYPH